MKEGFNKGVFRTDNYSVVFAASDALAHYIMMVYEVANRESFAQELNTAEEHYSKFAEKRTDSIDDYSLAIMNI